MFLQGGGELGRIIAEFDWGKTALGPIEEWPSEIKSIIGTILRSPVPIVTLWLAPGVMIYNDAYSVFAGGRHPALLGSNVREGWPEVADFNDNVMKVVLAGKTLAYTDQELTLNRTGVPEQVWMNLDYSPVPDENGVVLGVMAVVVETTAKVRAQHWLSGERQRLREMFQHAPGFMAMVTGPDHVYELANTAYLDLIGRHDVLGRSMAEVLPEVVPQGLLANLDRVYRTGQPLALTDLPVTLSGGGVRAQPMKFRYVDVLYQPVRDPDGQVVGIFTQGTDVTERVLYARELKRLNESLHEEVSQRTAERDRMWRLSTDIMLVADFATRIVAVNPAWQTLLGWSESDLLGNPFMDLIHPDDRESTQREMATLKAGMNTLRFENRYVCKDGRFRTLSWTAVPDDQHIHAVGRDVTEDRLAAQALKRTELALQQSQKMETIGKLTGGVAHDFNNLLQVISGNLQLLARDVVGNERALRRVDNARSGVARGAKLASQLLAFGRRQALEPRVIKIGRLISGIEDMLHRSLGDAVEIETVVSAGLWNTCVDPTQVENAVLNLAINARDAMGGVGKLTIEVGNAFLDDTYARAHAEVVAGQYVLLAVTDTGHGMTPEVMAEAFEPFFSTKPEGKGTGLGLSMVYGFVKQSGGHVKIYSEVGHGTSVKLYLPRSLDAEDETVVAAVAPVVGGHETILVAEDDEQVRGTVVEMMRDLGYHVLTAHDAASALKIVESGVHIDLLFTDVVMPGTLRSPELARLARKRLPDLMVLFTSGYTENAIVHGGRLDAGVELLGKPYGGDALARKLRQVLDARLRRSSSDVPQAPYRARASEGTPSDGGLPAQTAAGHTPSSAPTSAEHVRAAASGDFVPAFAAASAHAAASRHASSDARHDGLGMFGGETAASPAVTRLLLVEQDPDIRVHIVEMLRGLGHEVVPAASAAAALACIHDTHIDAVITDIDLPDMSGEHFVWKARQQLPDLGVVIANADPRMIELDRAVVVRKPYDTLALASALQAIAVRQAQR